MIWRKRLLQVVDHPSFGRMERDRRGQWTAEPLFPPIGTAVEIGVEGPEEGPPDWAASCFAELLRRYAELEPSILSSIFTRYQEHGVPPGCPDPSTSEELRAMLVLDGFYLHSPTALDVGFGFEEGLGWDDAMFTVELSDWAVAHCVMDD